MKVRDLLKFLEATDPECEVLVAEERSYEDASYLVPASFESAVRIEDDFPGSVRIVFRSSGEEA